MTKHTLEEICSTGLSDSTILSIAWEAGGQDLCVVLSVPSAEEAGEADTVHLRFVWAHNVVVGLDFGEYMGCPFAYEVALKRTDPARGWEAEFVFGGQPDGRIVLKCNEIQVT